MITRQFWAGSLGLCFVAIVVYGQNSTTKAVIFPPLTVAPTETVSLNIMSAASAYPGWTLLAACQAEVTFYRADGSIIGEPAAFVVGDSSQIFTAGLPSASGSLQVSLPAVVSVQLALTPDGGTASALSPLLPPCAVAFSMETFDSATGVTHVVVPGWAELLSESGSPIMQLGAISTLPCASFVSECELIYAFERTPSRIIVIPPMGVAPTETMQIDIKGGAAGYAGSFANTCSGVISFVGSDGATLGAQTTFMLDKTTQSFSAQLPYAVVGKNLPRPAVSAQISLTALPEAAATAPASTVPPCISAFSVKTYDSTTGVVHGYMTGQSGPDLVSTPTAGSSPVNRPPR